MRPTRVVPLFVRRGSFWLSVLSVSCVLLFWAGHRTMPLESQLSVHPWSTGDAQKPCLGVHRRGGTGCQLCPCWWVFLFLGVHRTMASPWSPSYLCIPVNRGCHRDCAWVWAGKEVQAGNCVFPCCVLLFCWGPQDNAKSLESQLAQQQQTVDKLIANTRVSK